MLTEIHDTVRRLLYEQGRISSADVEVTFDTPTRQWIERLTRPTLSLFLFGIEENTDRRMTSPETFKGNGHAVRRLPPRRIDLHYMVSAIATEIEDEHALAWRALATLMRNPTLPEELLPDEIRRLGIAVTTRVAQPDDKQRLLDIWGALGAEPHPAFWCSLTVPLDLEVTIEAPFALTRTVRVFPTMDTEKSTPEANVHIGGVVRGSDGEPVSNITVAIDGSIAGSGVTDDEGQFTVHGVPYGSVTLRLTRPDGTFETATIQVPSDRYELTLKEEAGKTKSR
jgi:hypothetical protein